MAPSKVEYPVSVLDWMCPVCEQKAENPTPTWNMDHMCKFVHGLEPDYSHLNQNRG